MTGEQLLRPVKGSMRRILLCCAANAARTIRGRRDCRPDTRSLPSGTCDVRFSGCSSSSRVTSQAPCWLRFEMSK
jgi:hypothetical protein